MPNMYSEEEKKAIVQEFNESGLSLGGFAMGKRIMNKGNVFLAER